MEGDRYIAQMPAACWSVTSLISRSRISRHTVASTDVNDFLGVVTHISFYHGMARKVILRPLTLISGFMGAKWSLPSSSRVI